MHVGVCVVRPASTPSPLVVEQAGVEGPIDPGALVHVHPPPPPFWPPPCASHLGSARAPAARVRTNGACTCRAHRLAVGSFPLPSPSHLPPLPPVAPAAAHICVNGGCICPAHRPNECGVPGRCTQPLTDPMNCGNWWVWREAFFSLFLVTESWHPATPSPHELWQLLGAKAVVLAPFCACVLKEVCPSGAVIVFMIL